MRLLISLSLACSLCACSMVPTLQRPVPPVPAHFPAQGAAQGAVQGATSAAGMVLPAHAMGWRTMFGDPHLQRLIELALEHNRDLRLAALHVEAAQMMSRVQFAGRLPSVSADAQHTRERALVAGNDGTANTAVNRQVGVGIGISAFELDLFGRVRAMSDAAVSRYLASTYGRDAAQIALVGAVANAYFTRQLATEQLQLAEQTLADWRQSLTLAHLLKEAQQHSGIDVAQAEGQVAVAEADVEARRRALAQAGNALQLLVGDTLPADVPVTLSQQPVVARLPAGLPSDLLLTRPDVQQAEQMLVAANADIGAARAAFFPQISLTASFGYASTSLGGLFDASQQVWRFVPQIGLPLFQGGRLRAELRLAEVRKSEAVVQYERTIQVAFREVADALAGTATFDRQIAAQQRAVSAAEQRLTLSNLRYRTGFDGRLELLDAQRQLYAARQALLALRHEDMANTVALYKALGGGLHAANGSANMAQSAQ